MKKPIDLIYVPYDSGRRNVRMGQGPLHIRAQGAAARLAAAGVSVRETVIETPDAFIPEARLAFELHRLVGDAVAASISSGGFPWVIAGNCNTAAIGTAAGVGTSDTGLLWFDAHDDCETPATTTSGFLDGMGLAILTGQCWPELLRTVSKVEPLPGDHAVLVGVRDISDAARCNVERACISRVSVQSIRDNGAAAALSSTIAHLRQKGVRRLVVHVDLDVHDPDAVAPANCFAVPDGLHAAEVRDAISAVSESIELVAACMGSYDPAFDVNGRMLATALDLLEFSARRA